VCFLAGVAVWGLINGRQLTTTGWIYIICFLLVIPASIRMIRMIRIVRMIRGVRIVRIVRGVRPRSGNDGPMN
jgi:hypothetical protein